MFDYGKHSELRLKFHSFRDKLHEFPRELALLYLVESRFFKNRSKYRERSKIRLYVVEQI